MKAPILPVAGTCGPRQRSSQWVPGVPVAYQLSAVLPAAVAAGRLPAVVLAAAVAVAPVQATVVLAQLAPPTREEEEEEDGSMPVAPAAPVVPES